MGPNISAFWGANPMASSKSTRRARAVSLPRPYQGSEAVALASSGASLNARSSPGGPRRIGAGAHLSNPRCRRALASLGFLEVPLRIGDLGVEFAFGRLCHSARHRCPSPARPPHHVTDPLFFSVLMPVEPIPWSNERSGQVLP